MSKYSYSRKHSAQMMITLIVTGMAVSAFYVAIILVVHALTH